METYIVIAIAIMSIAGFIGLFMMFLGWVEDDRGIFRVGSVVFGLSLILPWLWPIIVALGVPAAGAYGLWTTARAVKHRSFNY